MPNNSPQEVRERWASFCESKVGRQNRLTEEEIADWWLSEFQALMRERSGLKGIETRFNIRFSARLAEYKEEIETFFLEELKRLTPEGEE